jgi:hypothetical protein
MRRLGQVRRLSALPVLALSAVLSLAAQGLVTAATASTAGMAGATARPRPVGELDCNGLSPIQRPVKQGLMCADPRGVRRWPLLRQRALHRA